MVTFLLRVFCFWKHLAMRASITHGSTQTSTMESPTKMEYILTSSKTLLAIRSELDSSVSMSLVTFLVCVGVRIHSINCLLNLRLYQFSQPLSKHDRDVNKFKFRGV